uniref:FIT family protein n=1 Tax=Panagrellus redivivus TaxID=6233 RepID=A0A7E4UPL8_PANRE
MADYSTSSPTRRVPGPTTASDVVIGVLVAMARKVLFIPAEKKAIFYLVAVLAVSVFAVYAPPDDEYYVAKKHNVFNRYGTKLGWFWTLTTVAPFVYLTSYLHHNSHKKAATHLARLAIGTGIWYFVTNFFVHIEQRTGRCLNSSKDIFHRDECSLSGGKWLPGIDISGHAFLLIYNILIITEEAASFINWPSTPNRPNRIVSPNGYNEYKALTKAVQGLVLILFVFHLFWDFQLIVTCLYYHDINHKFLGAAAAVAAWAVSYKGIFNIFPGQPIRRKEKSF